MRRTLVTLLSDDSGATAIEYGVIAALIAAVMIPAASTVGAGVSEAFAELSAKLAPAEPSIRVL